MTVEDLNKITAMDVIDMSFRKTIAFYRGVKEDKHICVDDTPENIEEVYDNYLNKKRSEHRDKRQMKKRETVIYFIEAAEHGIKIGYTYDIEKRFILIQSFCPIKLKLLCVIKGDPYKEKEIHRKFSHLRMHNEWFKYDNEILNYISKIT